MRYNNFNNNSNNNFINKKKWTHHTRSDDYIPIKVQFSDSFKNNELLKKVYSKIETQTSSRNQACQKSRHSNNFRLYNLLFDTDTSVKTEMPETNQTQEINYEDLSDQSQSQSQQSQQSSQAENKKAEGQSQFDNYKFIPLTTFKDEYNLKFEISNSNQINTDNSLVYSYNSLVRLRNSKQMQQIQNQIVIQKATYQFDKENSKLIIDKDQIPKIILIIPNKDIFDICNPEELDIRDIVNLINSSFKSKQDNAVRVVFLWVGAQDSMIAHQSRNELRGETLRWTTDHLNKMQMDNFISHDIEFQNFTGTKEFVCQIENIMYSMVKVEEQQDQKQKKTRTHGHYTTMIENVKSEVQLLWVDMLMQVPGLTEYAAVAISKKQPTLGLLYKAWRQVEHKKLEQKKELLEKQELLKDLDQSNPNYREKIFKVGKKLSKRIFTVFNCTDPDRILDD